MDNIEDGLIGVDPDDTAEVAVGGARFTVGPIPAGIWEKLSSRTRLAFLEAKARAIRDLSAQGLQPDEVEPAMREVGSGLTRADMAAMGDETYKEKVVHIHAEAVSWAVRGHQKFLRRTKEPVPLEFVEVDLGGYKAKRLAESSMRFYRANPVVMREIWTSLWALNELGDAGKKV